MSEKWQCQVCGKWKRLRYMVWFKGKHRCGVCFHKRSHKMPCFETDILKKIISIEEETRKTKERWRRWSLKKNNIEPKSNNAPPKDL